MSPLDSAWQIAHLPIYFWVITDRFDQKPGFLETPVFPAWNKLEMWALCKSKGNNFCYRMVVLQVKSQTKYAFEISSSKVASRKSPSWSIVGPKKIRMPGCSLCLLWDIENRRSLSCSYQTLFEKHPSVLNSGVDSRSFLPGYSTFGKNLR